MRWLFLALIFVFTLAGGLLPVWFRRLHPQFMALMLVFTGAFLFGITMLHLVPESFAVLGGQAGLCIVGGFFLQVFLQLWSHGMEHGHSGLPAADPPAAGAPVHRHAVAASGLLLGLSVHAFMEGLPLGFSFRDPSTLPALFLGVLLHKLPEALTLMTMLLHLRADRDGNLRIITGFALVTPVAALLAFLLQEHMAIVHLALGYVIGVVTGAFLHISTTIFFESGTRQHEMNSRKTLAMLSGLALAAATLLLE